MRAVALAGLIVICCGASSAFLTLVANSQSLAPIPLTPAQSTTPNVGSDDMDEAVAAYYGCVRRVAAAMALASGEPAETIAKGAQGSCSDKLGKLNNVLTLMRSAGALTDLGLTKLTEMAEEQASNRALAAVIAARAQAKDQSDRAEAFVNCTTANADTLALASSEPAEKVAKAAVALCWKEAQAFAEADARTVGRHASTGSIEEVESIASRELVARIVAARNSRLH
jgi:hypothetical protein